MANGADGDVTDGTPFSVFLSYSRADQKAALPIIDMLEKAGFTVWWDGLLGGGEKFADKTDEALENTRAVVVLWSKTSIKSHWVHDEATRGRDRRCLVPLSIDGAEPPLGFRQFQVIDLSRSNSKVGSQGIAKLIQAVTALNDPSAKIVPVPAPAMINRRLLIGGGAVGLVAAGGIAAWQLDMFKAGRTGKLAILPFANIGGDKSQDYFSDGLSEELRNALATVSDLKIVAKTSSSKFRDDDIDPKKIASQLGVQFLLRGSVRQAADSIRVTAQLVDGKTGFDSWSDKFARTTTDIFQVQAEIANEVAKALSLRIPAAMGIVRPGGTSNKAAYDAFLRGVALYDLAIDEDSDRSALAQFDAAIKADPKYAAAWAERSRVLTTIANAYSKAEALGPLYDEAITSANKAVALAPNLAAGHASLGYVLFNGRLDAKAAAGPYLKSYEYGRGNADILQSYANFMARTGNFTEAASAIDEAVKLDPLNPISFRAKGRIEYVSGNLDAALADLETALKMNPKMNQANADIAKIHYQRGQYQKALTFYEKEGSQLLQLKGAALIQNKLGATEKAKAALENIRRDFGDSSLYQQAQILAQWGDLPNALGALEKAKAVGDSGLVLARNDPLLAPLKNETRFQGLLKSIGFEPVL